MIGTIDQPYRIFVPVHPSAPPPSVSHIQVPIHSVSHASKWLPHSSVSHIIMPPSVSHIQVPIYSVPHVQMLHIIMHIHPASRIIMLIRSVSHVQVPHISKCLFPSVSHNYAYSFIVTCPSAYSSSACPSAYSLSVPCLTHSSPLSPSVSHIQVPVQSVPCPRASHSQHPTESCLFVQCHMSKCLFNQCHISKCIT